MRPLIRRNVAVQCHSFSVNEQLDSVSSHAAEDVNGGNRRRQDAKRRGRFDSIGYLHPALQCPRRLNGTISQVDLPVGREVEEGGLVRRDVEEGGLVGRKVEEGGLEGGVEGRRVDKIKKRLGRKGKEGKPLQLVLNGGKHLRR